MRVPGVSRRERRTLITGATIIVTLVATTRGLPAWRAWQREARASAHELTSEAARAEVLVRSTAPLRDSLAARRERLQELEPTVLRGGTPAAAAGVLVSLITDAAAEANVRLGAVQVEAGADSTAGGGVFTRINVRGNAVSDVDGLASLLLALERGPERLTVAELAITQPDPAAPSDRPEMLRVEFRVEGLARVAPHASTLGGQP